MTELSDSELLAELIAKMPDVQRYRGTMNVDERLTVEAYDCAMHGDFDEARHRLRLRDKPKFWSEGACLRRYREAMSENRVAQESHV